MRILLLASASLFAASPTLAQRVDDNAVTDAEDAFGSNEGGEVLGVYDPYDVRGFSPIDAGNVRIEGLYIDRQADLSPRLIEGNRIRIGPSATGYAFPAPSGIVDYRLRTPGDEAALSLVTQVNSFGGALIEADGQLPLGGRKLAVGVGAAFSHSEYPSGNNADVVNTAAVLAWRPNERTEVKPFWSRTRMADEDIYPIIIGNGQSTPPRMTRRRFLGQHWADVESERFNNGVIARTRLAAFDLRTGLFRSINIVREAHSVLLDAAEIGTLVSRAVIGTPPKHNKSTSGEFGIARRLKTGAVSHELQLMVRARAQDRTFGGSHRVGLPPAPFDEPLFVPRASFAFTGQTVDKVRQWSAGVTWQAMIADAARINLGLQRTDYRKQVTTPGGALPESRDRPWLYNAAASVKLTRGLSIYGSIARGLEESEVAPATAANRDEAPPAILTRQIDGGFRWQKGPMAVIAGVFTIEKPYFGTDTTNIFRRLGTISHRGIEASVSGSPVPSLTLVAGGVLLDARLSGDEVASGSVGRRPIGTPSRTLTGNVDWRPTRWPALSFDLAVKHRGPSWSDVANRVQVDSFTTIDLGLRYRFRLAGTPAVFRLQGTNVFNAYGWNVEGNNAFVYIAPRQVLARLAIDL